MFLNYSNFNLNNVDHEQIFQFSDLISFTKYRKRHLPVGRDIAIDYQSIIDKTSQNTVIQ